MKIKEIILFTNRNVLIFNEHGEQIPKMQAFFSYKPLWSRDEDNIIEVVKQIIKDKPALRMSSWGKWINTIRLDEFCCLVGLGGWYFENSEVLHKQEQDKEP